MIERSIWGKLLDAVTKKDRQQILLTQRLQEQFGALKEEGLTDIDAFDDQQSPGTEISTAIEGRQREVVEYLEKNPDRWVSSSELAKEIWGADDKKNKRHLSVLMGKIREKKAQDDNCAPNIRSHRGKGSQGYRIDTDKE